MAFSEIKTWSKKKIALSAAAALLLLAVCAAAVLLILRHHAPEHGSLLVYRKGTQTVISMDRHTLTVSDASAEGFAADAARGMVFFQTASSYKDGSYDLYYAYVDSNNAPQTKLIDFGVERGFDLVDGKVYYLKFDAESGADAGCVCDLDGHAIETFSTNVSSLYAMRGAPEIYFIKMHGSTRVLYAYQSGEAPREVARNVQAVYAYDDCETPQLLYEIRPAESPDRRELYIMYSGQEPKCLCEDLYEALYAQYQGEGNLYFFTKAEKSLSWSAVISDPDAQTDAEMKQPERRVLNEFLSRWLFGLDQSYQTELAAYQQKLKRDEIRAALDDLVKTGGFKAPVYHAFVFHADRVDRVAENVDPGRVSASAPTGTPMLIYEDVQVQPNVSDMASLMAIAQRSSMEEVTAYAASLVTDSVQSKGLAIAAYGQQGATSAPLEGYDRSRTVFSFSSDGARVYAFVREATADTLTLSVTGIDADCRPAAREDIATGVSSYRCAEDAVLYLQTDVGKTSGDVYSYSADGSVKLANAATAFLPGDEETVFAIKNASAAAEPSADYYLCTREKETLISEQVVVASFTTEGSRAAFVCADGTLCVFANGKTSQVDTDVNQILLLS